MPVAVPIANIKNSFNINDGAILFSESRCVIRTDTGTVALFQSHKIQTMTNIKRYIPKEKTVYPNNLKHTDEISIAQKKAYNLFLAVFNVSRFVFCILSTVIKPDAVLYFKPKRVHINIDITQPTEIFPAFSNTLLLNFFKTSLYSFYLLGNNEKTAFHRESSLIDYSALEFFSM